MDHRVNRGIVSVAVTAIAVGVSAVVAASVLPQDDIQLAQTPMEEKHRDDADYQQRQNFDKSQSDAAAAAARARAEDEARRRADDLARQQAQDAARQKQLDEMRERMRAWEKDFRFPDLDDLEWRRWAPEIDVGREGFRGSSSGTVIENGRKFAWSIADDGRVQVTEQESADAPERCTNPMPAFAVTSVKTTCESGFACAAASSGTISAVPAIATAVPLVMTVS